MTTKHTEPIVLDSRSISSRPWEGFEGLDGGSVNWKTLLSAGKTNSNTFTSGIARCAPNGGHLKCHRHTHPELYCVTSGRGIVRIDGVEHPVEQGSVVFIPGDAEHSIWNTGQEEDLQWLYVFATDRFQDVVYRFSDEPRAKL